MSESERPPAAAIGWPTQADLIANFRIKHGDPEKTGWSPRRRFRFGYHRPEDVYESLVSRLVRENIAWIDVGGGGSLFPHNPSLARDLADRCRLLVGVDPSDNVRDNPFLHERAQCFIEDYETEHRFDLATLRMVAEHVTEPDRVVGKLAELLAPGGRALIFTVNLWAPLTVMSRVTPFWLHYPLKKIFWGGEEKDTFPTVYRMNTRRRLREQFEAGGFREVLFGHADDCSTFGSINALNLLELSVWRCFRALGLRYPENCLIGVYERQ